MMLTKDLLRYKVSGDLIKPAFIAPAESRLLDLAERLTAVFDHAVGFTREELEEQRVLSARLGRCSPSVPRREYPPAAALTRRCTIDDTHP